MTPESSKAAVTVRCRLNRSLLILIAAWGVLSITVVAVSILSNNPIPDDPSDRISP
jgi:hypothetical protein